VHGGGVERVAPGLFDDPPEIHHRHIIGEVLDNSEIVRDEKIRKPKFILEIAEQVQHLSLYRDVQCADRFIADDEIRIARQGARDPDSLPLTTREFVRVTAGVHRGEPHPLEQIANSAMAIPTANDSVHLKGLGDDAPHRHSRIQRTERVLEDHRHTPAAPSHRRSPHREHILTIEGNSSAL
jgi:hypothetical protein